jgi:hypothetical protein
MVSHERMWLCEIAVSAVHERESGPLAHPPARGLLGLQGGDAALQIGGEMAGIALP